MGAALALDSVRFAYRQALVFEGLKLQVPEGEMTAVLGPNGSGKTTLLKLAAGFLQPSSGTVSLFGKALPTLPSMARARIVAVVPQESQLLFDFAVRDVVLMGRNPHQGFLGLESAHDLRVANAAMERTDVAHLGSRSYQRLSGGERQRVVIARALAQEPRLLLLDEPTAFLDLRHQLEVYGLLRRLSRENGLTLVLASHDLNLAARFCDRIVLLRDGTIRADGPPSAVLTPETLRAVYDVEVQVRTDDRTGRPWLLH